MRRTQAATDDEQLGRGGDGRSPARVGGDGGWRIAVGGSDHSVAIRQDGTLWSWGSNAAGQLGRSGATGTPAQVGSGADWTQLACSHHTLALKSNGTLWSWGDNGSGQLGRSGATDTPAQVGAAADWAAVGGGRYHSLAVRRDGSLWSWGDNEDGQLGDGTTKNSVTLLNVMSLDGTPPTTAAGGVPPLRYVSGRRCATCGCGTGHLRLRHRRAAASSIDDDG